MQAKRILILGGTGEARALAALLVDAGHDVTTSLAGVTEKPMMLKGKPRIGGFGGVEGLRDYLRVQKVDVVVDATHPFAVQISRHAALACDGVQLLRLERPAWVKQVGDHWIDVADVSRAVAALPYGANVFCTIGRKEVGAIVERSDLSGVARMIEPPPTPPTERWKLLLQRPPFSLASEIALMRENEITHVVSKNAGGGETENKIAAARQLGIPVVMIARPTKPVVAGFSSPQDIADHISKLGRISHSS